MYSVSVLADNNDSVLLPGMTAYVSMVISEKKDVLRVPASALRFKPPVKEPGLLSQLFPGIIPKQAADISADDDSKIVYLLKAGEPVPVKVATGATDDTFVEISGGGVAEGDKVVTGIQSARN